MKIFSSTQIREWDVFTIQEQGLSSHELMERAARTCFEWMKKRFLREDYFYIFCGTGNNGGDGLALTRLLLAEGFCAKAFLLQEKELTIDTQKNVVLLRKVSAESLFIIEKEISIIDIPKNAIVIDALLGTGLNRALNGLAKEIIEKINLLPNKKIAIDIPSGLFPDKLPNADDACFSADWTLSFQTYKRSFFYPEAAKYTGVINVLDIGLSKDFSESNETTFFTLDEVTARSLYKPRNPFGHKGTYGTAVLVGGSYGKIGAIILSAKAALRAGAGKVFIQAPHCGYTIAQTSIPEAMFIAAGENFIDSIDIMEDVVRGIGPGLGTEPASRIALESFLRNNHEPFVIDADGLNIIAKNKEKLLPLIPEGSIITPHPKEFERLFGRTNNSLERNELAIAKSKEHKIYIILKGHRTQICTPEGACYFNLSGNAGMATAGSGDVLTGIITGLLAQGYSAKEATLLGVYLHGLSGDIAAKRNAQEALIASDMIDLLGQAFLRISPE